MHRSGFTLIEVLIAMSIFAVISVITFQGIRSSMTVQERVEGHAQDLVEMQLLWTVLFQDFVNMARRPIREEGRSELRPAFDADPDDSECRVSFTRAGLPSGSALPAGMQRLAYCIRGGDLYRVVWPVLDRARDTQPQESLLMEDIDDFIVETYPDFDPEEEKTGRAAADDDAADTDDAAADDGDDGDDDAADTDDAAADDGDDDVADTDDADDRGADTTQQVVNKYYELPVGVVVTIETSEQNFVRWFPGGEEYQLDI